MNLINIVKNLSDDSFDTVSSTIVSSHNYEVMRGRKARLVINLGLLKSITEANIEKKSGYVTLCLAFAKYVSGTRIPINVIREIMTNKVWLEFKNGCWYASDEKILLKG